MLIGADDIGMLADVKLDMTSDMRLARIMAAQDHGVPDLYCDVPR
jgi:hypothetical protein